MEELYVKAGNQERGWNDPPQFSYGLQRTRGPQRLQKLSTTRTTTGGAPPPLYPLANPLAPPPAGPPPGCVAPPLPPSEPMRGQKEAGSSQSESEPDVGAVVLVLSRALAACRQTSGDQVCNDVGKRLRLLEDGWRSGQLSLPVRRRMDALSQELQSGHWDAADEIHRSLMVDHVTEVIQWMVGVKRLIAETRNLSPELLQQLVSPAGPEQEPVSRS